MQIMTSLCLFSVIILLFTSLIQSELLSLPGCPGKCGNLTIPFPFGLNSDCYFDNSFHIICNISFEPPKPFLWLGSAEVVSISLDGKLEVLEKRDTSSEYVPKVVEWTAGNAACHVARNDASRYACQSLHSRCNDSSVGQGYICRCLPGYQGNPYLLDGCQDIDECATSNPCEGVCINMPGSFKCYCPHGFVGDGRKDGTGCHPVVGVNYSAFPLGIIVVVPMMMTWIVWTGRQKKLEQLREDLFEENGGNLLKNKLRRRKNPQLKIYTAEDMKLITNNYLSRNVMLRCSPGTFYRGTLSNDSTDVAVVKIEKVTQSRMKQFVKQLIMFSQPHNNLVRVIGCCLETPSPLIVCELHGDGNATLFDSIHTDSRFLFAMRVKLAAEIARGLAYLNSLKSETTFVHGNICSANIVMDSLYDAKIFYAVGSNLIARGDGSSYQDNYVYKDPHPVNKKSDVYSFGVVLVELLTGGKTLSLNIALAKGGRLREILDEETIAETDAKVVVVIAKLVERCLNVEPSKRPKMKEVEAELSMLIQML